MKEPVRVACVQAESVVLERGPTIEKIESLAEEVAANGARLALFPEAFIPVYPSNRWVRYLAGWSGDDDARRVHARLAQESLTIPGPDSDRLAQTAERHGLWLAVGANELERGTIYNSLLLYSPEGELALHHRKLMPTNHERLVWGGTTRSGTSRESRAFVLSCCVFQRASSYPENVPLAEGDELLGRGGSAILAPDGTYLAGPLWDEEGVLYADLDPARLYEARQRFDPAGHYHRPDVFRLVVGP